nr:hypothetical protein [Mycoplasmopsis bovis]
MDVATLTGAILSALGKTYSGVWSTDESNWATFEKAAKIAKEKVWRMPSTWRFSMNQIKQVLWLI